jgi:hypothetical protein
MKRPVILFAAAALATLLVVAPQAARSGGERKAKERDRKSNSEQARGALNKQKEIAKSMEGAAAGSAKPDPEAAAAAQAELDQENTRFTERLASLRESEREATAGKDRKRADRIRRQIGAETEAHAERVAQLQRKIDTLRGGPGAGAVDGAR